MVVLVSGVLCRTKPCSVISKKAPLIGLFLSLPCLACVPSLLTWMEKINMSRSPAFGSLDPSCGIFSLINLPIHLTCGIHPQCSGICLLLDLCSGLTLGGAQGIIYVFLGDGTGVGDKASTLPPIVSPAPIHILNRNH